MTKSAKIDLRLPPDLKEMVREEAERQHASMAWIVLTAVRAYLPPKPSIQTTTEERNEE
jgi:predicted transcriptional regulator